MSFFSTGHSPLVKMFRHRHQPCTKYSNVQNKQLWKNKWDVRDGLLYNYLCVYANFILKVTGPRESEEKGGGSKVLEYSYREG
jgi:hypothetical protein